MVTVSSGGYAVRRSPDEVFAFLADIDGYTAFFAGLSRWEPLSEQHSGVGARFRVLLSVGSVQAGGTVRITEWRAGRRIAWEWETGVRQSGGWTLTPLPTGTGVDLTIRYSLGGPTAWFVERLSGRVVAHELRATVLGLRRRLEHPELSRPRSRRQVPPPSQQEETS